MSALTANSLPVRKFHILSLTNLVRRALRGDKTMVLSALNNTVCLEITLSFLLPVNVSKDITEHISKYLDEDNETKNIWSALCAGFLPVSLNQPQKMMVSLITK